MSTRDRGDRRHGPVSPTDATYALAMHHFGWLAFGQLRNVSRGGARGGSRGRLWYSYIGFSGGRGVASRCIFDFRFIVKYSEILFSFL